MREKTKIRKTFNIDIDASEKFKMIVPDNEQSKRINQFILDEIERNSDLILESEIIMIFKGKLGKLNTKIKEMNKLHNELIIQIPILKSERDFIISEIDKQRVKESEAKNENGDENADI